MPLRLVVLALVAACGAPTPKPAATAREAAPVEAEHRPAMSAEVAAWIRQLDELDPTKPGSTAAARQAAESLAAAKVVAAIPALAALAARPVDNVVIGAQVAAIRAIGTIGDPAGVAPLIALLGRPTPRAPLESHPCDGCDVESVVDLDVREAYSLHLASTGAVVNALATLRAPRATSALLLQIYKTPPLAMQVRRALVATGPRAADEVRQVLRGEHAEVTALVHEHALDRYCSENAPGAPCLKVSIVEFYAAVLLGDLHDRGAVSDLLAGLGRPALPYYYLDDAPGPSQHQAIFDALRTLGPAEAAAPLRALWSKPTTELQLRLGAVSAYPFAARDDAGVDELGRIAADNSADDGLRQEAATAFARLGHDRAQIAILVDLAQKYLDASAKKRHEADGKPKERADLAEAAFAKAKVAHAAALAQFRAVVDDPHETAAQVGVASRAAKAAEETFARAKKTHHDEVARWKELDSAAKAYLGYARMFQTHVARIEIAIRCKDQLACYAASLALTAADVARDVAPYIRDVDGWTADERSGLVQAAVERAMLELGKQGAKATAHTEVLLDHAGSEDRLVRQSILLALGHVATLPCPTCVAKLDRVIAADAGKSALGDLTLETTLLRNYFVWAK